MVNAEHQDRERPNGASVAMNSEAQGLSMAQVRVTVARVSQQLPNGASVTTTSEAQTLKLIRTRMTVAQHGLAHRRGEF